jgi:hypothetical protein
LFKKLKHDEISTNTFVHLWLAHLNALRQISWGSSRNVKGQRPMTPTRDLTKMSGEVPI